jgi:hypothetical protein
MKAASFELESGVALTVKPEALTLLATKDGTALCVTNDHGTIPLVFFKAQLATDAEVAARAEKAKEK